MRWVKAMVITAIVLTIIPSIIMTINNISGGETKYEEYEIIITKDNVNETVPELYNLVEFDENNNLTNLIYVEYDGVTLNVNRAYLYYDDYYEYYYLIISYISGGNTYNIRFNFDNPAGSIFTNYVKIALYKEIVVGSPLLTTELILISLIPLILVSGLLVYQYKELGLKIRKE